LVIPREDVVNWGIPAFSRKFQSKCNPTRGISLNQSEVKKRVRRKRKNQNNNRNHIKFIKFHQHVKYHICPCHPSVFERIPYCNSSATDLREDNHVFFINYHLYTSSGNHRHCDTEQYAFGFQIFCLEFSNVYYGPDFLFLSLGGSNRGNFDLTKAGEKIPSCEEHEQRDP